MELDFERTGTGARSAVRAPAERVADVLASILVEAGVDTVFGLPGGPISPLHDALLDRPGVRVLTHRHEASAIFAAAGWAQTTGRIGVALVTSGPGILNSFTGIASAACDGLPVLVLAGEAPRKLHGRGVVQDGSSYKLKIVEMARCIAKYAAEVPEAGAAPAMLRRAIATALSGRRGPAVLTLPMDLATARIAPAEMALCVDTAWAIDARAIERCARAFAPGRRTAIFVGSGVRGGDGPARLRAFAEKVQAPVITTPKAKGVFPEDHPLALGVFGIGGHPSAAAWLERGVDTLLVVGSGLSDISTEGWSPLLQSREELIQVDIESTQIGRSYQPTLAIVAPASLFLQQLTDRVAPQAILRDFGGVRSVDRADAIFEGATGYIAPQRAIWELQRALPSDTIFTCDVGEHAVHAIHNLRLRAPDQWIWMSGLGSMGSSLGTALASQLAHPRRTVVAICGDGCFAMNAFELATMVAERLPVIVAVMNDRRLGMVENGHSAVYGRAARYPNPVDAAAVARALGASAFVAERAGDIMNAPVFKVSGGNGPLVIDVRIDPTVQMPRRDRFANASGAFAPVVEKPVRRVAN